MNVPVGTLCSAFRLEHIGSMFQSEHIASMFQLEHNTSMFRFLDFGFDSHFFKQWGVNVAVWPRKTATEFHLLIFLVRGFLPGAGETGTGGSGSEVPTRGLVGFGGFFPVGRS